MLMFNSSTHVLSAIKLTFMVLGVPILSVHWHGTFAANSTLKYRIIRASILYYLWSNSFIFMQVTFILFILYRKITFNRISHPKKAGWERPEDDKRWIVARKSVADVERWGIGCVYVSVYILCVVEIYGWHMILWKDEIVTRDSQSTWCW